MATPAERRAAQRRLAKEIKEGTFKPSEIGKKARELAGRTQLIDSIQALKVILFRDSPYWKTTSSKRHIAINPTTGRARTVEELKEIRDKMQEKLEEITESSDPNMDDTFYKWHYVFDDMEPDYRTAGFYK